MHSTTRLQLRELNPHLLCVLCGGYLIDATTIIECIHSFCRTCIIKYLESSKYCPICDVQVHKTKPLLNVRSDKTLQTLVYKLVPSLFKDEMRRRREFYAAHPDQSIQSTRSLNASELRGEVEIGDDISTKRDDEQISLCLQSCAKLPPYQNEHLCTGRSVDNDQIVDRRYLLCPSSVTIGHLKKLIRLKFDLPPMYRIDIFYSDEGLRDSYTLLDVAHIYSWRRVEPLKLYYIVHDRSLSQLHLSPPSVKDMVKHRKDGRAANKRSISLYTIRMSVSDNENADSNSKVQNEESGSSAQPASGIDNDTDRDGGRVPNKGEEDQHESSKEEGKENVSRDGEHGGVAEPAAVESAAVEPAAVEPAAVEPATVEDVRTVGEVTGDEEKDKGSPRDQMEKCLEEGAGERHDEVDTADSAETAPEAAQRTQNDHVTGEGGGAAVMDANKSDTHSIKEDGTRPSVHVLESEGRQGDRTSRDGGDVTGKPSSDEGKANGAQEVGKPCNKKAVEQTDGQTPREAGGVPSEKASAGSDKPEVVRRPPARVLSSQSNNNKLVSSENDLCSAGRTTAQRSQPANGRLGAVELKKVGMLSRGLSNGGQRWLLPNCLPNQPHLQRSASPRYVTMADGQQYPVLFVGTPDALCPVTFSGGGVSLLSAIQSSGRSGSTGAKQMNCFFRKNSYVMAPRLVGVAHARDGPSGGGAIRPDGRSEPNGERRPKTGKDQTGYWADATWRGADPLRNGSSSSSEVGERSDGDAPRLLNGRDPVAAGANRKRSRREDALDCKPSKVARRNGVDKPPEELCNGKTVVTTMAIEKHVIPNA